MILLQVEIIIYRRFAFIIWCSVYNRNYTPVTKYVRFVIKIIIFNYQRIQRLWLKFNTHGTKW